MSDPDVGTAPTGLRGGVDPSASTELGETLRVVQLVTTLARGGAQATVLASSAMAEYGIAVTVLAGCDDRGEGTLWHGREAERADLRPVPSLVRSVSPLRDIRALWWLVRWIRSERPDLVHTHSTKAGVLGRLAAALTGVPCVHTIHGWGPLHSAGWPAQPLVVGLERMLAKLSKELIVVGTADRAIGLQFGIGVPGRYRLIRSGVDLPACAPTSSGLACGPDSDRERFRADLGVADRFVVGMVARLSPPKDHATLLDAFGRCGVAGAVLLIVGEGPERQRLEALAAARCEPGTVRFLGARTDAAQLVCAFDVAVLSSDWEGLPRAVVEAAAGGVPVVASDVGSISDLIENDVSGRLVSAGDADELASAIRSVADGAVQWRPMVEEAARRVLAFSSDRMRDDLAALWFEAASNGRPAGIAGVPAP